MTGDPLLLDLSAEVCAHASIALAQYRERLARQYVTTPPELVALERALASRWAGERSREVSMGQDGPELGAARGSSDAGDVPARLLTIPEVATATRMSASTVKRNIAAGRLAAVHVGRAVRIRVEDLDAHLSALGK